MSKSIFRIKRVLKVPQPIMLKVVGDVSRYHEFVPYCKESVVTQQVNNIPSRAKLVVGWNGFNDGFESKLTYKPDTVVAEAATTSLFDKLSCTWTIKEISKEQCHAALDLEFKFANSVYNVVAGNAGPLVAKKMIQAFSQRALEINDKAKL